MSVGLREGGDWEWGGPLHTGNREGNIRQKKTTHSVFQRCEHVFSWPLPAERVRNYHQIISSAVIKPSSHLHVVFPIIVISQEGCCENKHQGWLHRMSVQPPTTWIWRHLWSGTYTGLFHLRKEPHGHVKFVFGEEEKSTLLKWSTLNCLPSKTFWTQILICSTTSMYFASFLKLRSFASAKSLASFLPCW